MLAAVQPDVARVMDHLDDDQHLVAVLCDLVVVVVEAIGEHRRRAVAPERGQAAVGEAEFLRIVEDLRGLLVLAEQRRRAIFVDEIGRAGERPHLLCGHLRAGPRRRDLAVGGGDQRGARLARHAHDLDARIQEAAVVAADGAVGDGRRTGIGPLVATIDLSGRRTLDLRNLSRCHGPARAVLGRPGLRRHGGVGPGAFEVRLAEPVARNLPANPLGQGRAGQQCERQGKDQGVSHGCPPSPEDAPPAHRRQARQNLILQARHGWATISTLGSEQLWPD